MVAINDHRSNRRKKLEQLIDKAVQKHLKLTIEDMEVVRKSPAASIIRLEDKVELMVTKEDFKEEISKLEEKLGGKIGKLEARIGKLEDKVELMVSKDEFGERVSNLEGVMAGFKSTQKFLISLYLSILAIVGAMFIKMFFFQ